MADSATLGEVSVDVYADLTRMNEGFQRALAAAARLDQEIAKRMGAGAKATNENVKSLGALARAYDPVNVAMTKYKMDQEEINRLQREGVLSSKMASQYLDKAADAYNKVADAQSRAHKFGQMAGEAISRWSKWIAVSAGIAAVAYGRMALQQAAAVKATSDQLNVSVEDWQRYLFIANQVQVSAGSLEMGFEQLGKAMGRASMNAKSRDAKLFKALGIDMQEAAFKAGDVAKVMPKVADALNSVENRAQRAQAATVLFGQAGDEMARVMAGGSERIRELSQAADELGVVLSREEIESVDETAQKLQNLNTVLTAQMSHIIAQNSGSIISLANAIARVTAAVVNFLGSNPQGAIALLAQLGAFALFGGKGIIAAPAIAGALTAEKLLGGREVRQAGGRTQSVNREEALASAARLTTHINKLVAERDELQSGFFKNANAVRALNTRIGAAAMLRTRYQDRADALRPGSAGGISAYLKGGNAGAASGKPVDLTGVFTPEKKGGKPKSSNSAAAGDRAFEMEMAGIAQSILRAQIQNAGSAEERADLEDQLLDLDRDRFEAGLRYNVATKRYTAAEAEELRAKYDILEATERQQIAAAKRAEMAEEDLALISSEIEGQMQILDLQGELAKTDKDRNRIESELLDLSMEKRRNEILAKLQDDRLKDVDRQILEAEYVRLGLIEDLNRELLRRKGMNPIERFYDDMVKTDQQVLEAYQALVAAKLQDRVQQSAQFADDISGAFSDVVRGLVSLNDPIDLLRDLITNLASIFTEEVIVRPMQDWVRQNVAGPVAERVTGFPAGAGGLSMKQLEEGARLSGVQLWRLGTAAEMASQALTQMALQGMGKTSLWDAGLGLLGGGITAKGAMKLLPGVDKMIAANPGIFHDGGMIGPGGRPLRRRPGEVGITAKVGEYIMPEGPTREFRPLLDRMRAGGFSGLAGLGARGGNQRNLSVSYGDIVVNGVSDERAARRTAKQIAAEVQATIAKSSRQGIRRHD